MESMQSIVILDSLSSVRSRVKAIFEDANVKVHEASNPIEFFNLMAEMHYDTDLIVMEIEFSDEDGFEILRRIKAKNRSIPVIILTASNRRRNFIKGIIEGAADYILKPFEDSVIHERILKRLSDFTSRSSQNKLSFNLDDYLNSELKKASKGNYSISVLLSTFFKPVNEITPEQERQYIILSESIYKSLKTVVWETDIFEKYGSQTFIGVFPFCDAGKVEIIDKKLTEKFEEMKTVNESLKQYHIANAFVTFPDDGQTNEELIKRVTDRMKEEIEKMKISLIG